MKHSLRLAWLFVVFMGWAALVRAADNLPPTVINVSPSPGTIYALTNITVTFSGPVIGVSFSDLLIKGTPALEVAGSGAVYTFVLEQPAYGTVQITWDPDHAIVDVDDEPAQRFNEMAAGSTWQYDLVDTTSPVISSLTPVAGVTVRQLTQIEVVFSEPVAGVEASDLLINRAAATGLSIKGPGRYLFTFPQPASGLVEAAWRAGHGIHDFAASPNDFAGGAWNYTLDPNAGLASVRINELTTSNIDTNRLKDENGDLSDWIELWNYGTNAVNLAGCSLTDDKDDPGKWVFPTTNLGPGQFIVVFASAKDRKTLTSAANRYHTNFKLNPFGNYLALFNAESPRVPLAEFAPKYPEQRNDYSYGYDNADVLKYFGAPTPGAPNGNSSISGIVPPVHFNVDRGCFDSPFTLILNTSLAGATIRYTTDGTEPTLANGTTYFGPLQITNTTSVRVAAFKANMLPSITVTHTYLFLDQVLRQPNNPPGFPVGATVFTGYPSDYEMDPEIVTNGAYGPSMKAALKALPAVSIVMKVDDMFGAANGIYTHPEPSADQRSLWERACSVEFIPTDGASGFQVNCGIRIQGNASRTPIKTPKHPFRLMFKGNYGPGQLDYPIYPDSPVTSFNTLVLRADFNNSWLHWDGGQRLRGTRIRDAWAKDSFRAMGGLSGHSRYFHLYLNGVYWGIYDFGERVDATFAASYLGGEPEDYDAIASKPTEAIDGDINAYNAMLNAVRTPDMRILNNYTVAQQFVDMTNFIDYMLLNFYGGNQDWGVDGNWNAVRRRAPGETFKYVTWDGEQLVVNTGDNRVTSTDLPSALHPNLVNSPEYRLTFGDRVQRHLFNGGALTTNAIIQRWLQRAAEVDLAILAESARWGDYRRDVHQYQTGPYSLYTRDGFWLPEINRMVTNYFPLRQDIFLQQLRSAGLYPIISAPSFNQHGGRVPHGFRLTITATNPIYFTTNGSDPRVYGTGAISAQAQLYSGPVVLNSSVIVKARALNNTNWSAVNEARFTVDRLGVPLRITEIMYNPIGGDAYEFIELQNVGGTAIDIGSFSFEGISYVFPPGTMLAAGAIIVLGSSSSPGNWTNRYPGVTVFGRFDGSLSNGGEKIAIKDASGNTVSSVDYDDENGWPMAADGQGYSLEIIDPFGDPDDPVNWRASAATNGTPGTVTPPLALDAVVLNEVMADNLSTVSNGGAYPDWIELYNPGTQAVGLAGWSLTDDSNPRKFVFPADTTLPAGGYLVVWCDSLTNTSPGLHTGFALGRKGDSIFFYNASTSRVDAVTFGLQLSDYSVGRVGGTWQLTTPTPNALNQPAALASSTNITINEWLANAAPGGDDWVELYNRSATAPVALRGMYLGTSNVTFQITSLSFIPAGGYVQLLADEGAGPDHLDCKLPAAGGAIVLYDESGLEQDRVLYGAQSQGVSQGRLPDGNANTINFPGSASPGASNYVLGYTGPRLNEVLVINHSAVTNGAGHTADFVELWNTNASAFDLVGMRLSTDGNKPDEWFFPAGVSIPANGYLVIWFDGESPASTLAGPILNTGHSLAGESGEVFLFNSSGQPVDSVVYGFQVADLPIGQSGGQWTLLAAVTPGAANSNPAILGAVTSLRLNEWMAHPPSGNDWFEIYNPGSQPVPLAGLYLANNPSSLGLTQFPISPLSFIGAKGFVKFIADADQHQGRDHVNFNLDADGESLRIYSATFGIIDAVYFGFQPADVSQGRLPDGTANIVSFPETPTPGESNYLPIPNAVINEVLTHTNPPLEDAIELYNRTGQAVDIGGWYLTDSPDNFRKYQIASGTILPAYGFKVFYENQFNGGVGSLELFTFDSAHGDAAYLSASDGSGNLTGYRSQVRFGAAENGVSFGLFQTSRGVEFVAQSQRTFGIDHPSSQNEFRSGAGTTNASPKVGPVVINELMYHPPDVGGTNDNSADEYIELYNLTTAPVPLYDPAHATNRWRLRGGADFDFPIGASLASRAFLLVVSFDPTDSAALSAFRNQYGLGTNVAIFGPYQGKLDNGGENIELHKPDPPQGAGPDAGFVPYILVDQVNYDDEAPWPLNADGGGASLQRQRPDEFGNDPVNWKAEGPTPGRANVAGSSYADTDGDGISDAWEVAHGLNRFDPADAAQDWDADGRSNYAEYLDGTDPQNASSRLVPPSITTDPQNQIALPESNVTFTVAASGTAPFTYQWRFNGKDITGEISSMLTLNGVQPTDAGGYSVLVINAAGFATSLTANLVINIPPVITAHPQSLTVNPGANVTFNVSATGSGLLRYQWQINGTNIAGAINAALTLTNVQLANSGNYTAVVTDDIASVSSLPATLTVLVRPTITQQPVGMTLVAGRPASFNISTSGTLPMSYRWRKVSATITNMILYANSSTFTIPSVVTNDAGSYNVAITNVAGAATALSSNAILTVVLPPTNQTANAGADVTFSVLAVGPPPIRYQWQFNAANLPNATNTTLVLAGVQPANQGAYTVVITNAAGLATGFSAALTVGAADSDGDGIPDAWEIANGLDPHNAADAALDGDGDTMTNLQEYIAGTDPRDGQSYLKLEISASGGAMLEFKAVAERSYTIEYREALGSTPWDRLADVDAASSDRMVQLPDPAGTGTRFYRLRTPKRP